MIKLCFDIDGVICRTYKNYYNNSKPNKLNIKIINKLFNNGFYIIIYTARFMGRSNENQAMAKKKAYKLTCRQLKSWKLKYHKLIFGKPSFDFLIDDKSIFFKKNWSKFIKRKFLHNN